MASAVLVLLVLICALAWLAERVRLPPPLFYLSGGLLYGFLAPGLALTGLLKPPPLPFDSGVVFAIFFPVLLYGAAFQMPWNDFRVNAVRSVFFGLSNVVLVTLAVGAFAHFAFGLPFALACLLGVSLADPDFSFFMSRANEANTSRPLRRAVASEGLVEGTAMLLLYLALSDAVTKGDFALAPLAAQFALGPIIGGVVGFAVARACVPIFGRIRNPSLAITASLALPFLAYLPAQALGGVRLAAVVVAGFVSGERIDPVMGAGARQAARGSWNALIFVVNGAIYVPAGAVLAGVLTAVDVNWSVVAWGSLAIALVCLLTRFAWSIATWGVVRRANLRLGPWGDMAMGTLGATRGVFALAAALALPTTLADGSPVPERDLLIALALGTAAVSLALQGPLIARTIDRLPQPGDGREDRERLLAWREIAQAGIATIDDQNDDEGEWTSPGLRALRTELRSVVERTEGEGIRPADDVDTRLRVLESQRTRLRKMRDEGRISGETFQEIEGQIDQHIVYLETSRSE